MTDKRIYHIDGDIYEDARSAAEYIMEYCDNSYYDDMLDECYPEVDICGYTYAPSVALYRTDPIAYNCGRSDWADFEARNIAEELEELSDGEILKMYDFEILCEEIEEKEEKEDEN